MNTREEQEYIRKNTTHWDRFGMDLIYLTVASGILIIAFALILVVVLDEDIQLTVNFLYWWVPLAVISVILNVRGARKINRLLNEFRSKK